MLATVFDLPQNQRIAIGMLVRHALNVLFSSSPDAAPAGYTPDGGLGRYAGCCPNCCAPCRALHDRLQAGSLERWVLLWPDDLTGHDWWDEENKQVNRDWLHRAWNGPLRQACCGTKEALT